MCIHSIRLEIVHVHKYLIVYIVWTISQLTWPVLKDIYNYRKENSDNNDNHLLTWANVVDRSSSTLFSVDEVHE